MKAAYARMNEVPSFVESPINVEEREKISESYPQIEKIETGKHEANFEFPEILLGKKGLKKEKKIKFSDNFDLKSATTSNVMSLVHNNENPNYNGKDFRDDYQVNFVFEDF